MVLTEETAKRLFGDEDPWARCWKKWPGNFKVTGVLAPFPGKTHLEFEALGSLATLSAMESSRPDWQVQENWNNYYMTYNFVRLREGEHPQDVEKALTDIATSAYRGRELETRDAGYVFHLQPLGEITPGPLLSNSMGRGLPAMLLWFLSTLCAIVIASACFNYTSLTIARSFSRAKEVGIRKVLGASRRQVFSQFLSEALVIAVLSYVLAQGLLELTIPYFNRLQFLAFSDVTLRLDWIVAGAFMLFTLLVGIVAGALPAAVLSRLQPLAALQALQNTRLFRRVGLRKALLVSQFAVSLIFIILLTVAWRQMNYAIGENFGADRADILNVEMQGLAYDKLASEFSRVSQVRDISATSHLMGTWQDSKVDVRGSEAAEAVPVRDYFIDHRFIPNLGLTLVAGENFPENTAQQRELFAIVNEKFLERFGLGTPAEAIHRVIYVGDGSPLAIRGVVKDFLYKPLSYQLEPLLLRCDPAKLNLLNLKLSGTTPEAIAALENVWKNLGGTSPWNITFTTIPCGKIFPICATSCGSSATSAPSAS